MATNAEHPIFHKRGGERVKCSHCGKSFAPSGLQVHITRAHGYDMWKAQQAKREP